MSDERPVRELVEHLFRHQAGRMLSTLSRIFGLENLDLAEEVVQEAMLKALRQWPYRGIPENPTAWLVQAARNDALDILRRRSAFRREQQALESLLRVRDCRKNDGALPHEDGGLEDDQLAMMFACCHPAIPDEARVALTLNAVGGFSAKEIARAFLAPETTMAQRLVRAKRRIREEKISLTLPPPFQLQARLDSVLQVIYLMFNEGYAAHQGVDLIRHDLCGEAIRLAGLLASRGDTALPKVEALLALMLLQASRLPARVDDAGDLLLLCDQDRTLWDQNLLHLGLRHLERATAGNELTEYHLQAGHRCRSCRRGQL
jgi:RNA polymerase sigma-70 factor (ECF subfamily)